VGYVPQGYGHSIENVGTKTARILIAFNTGSYQAIDLSQWLAANPAYLLADHFGIPAETIERFPHSSVFIAPDRKV
jgi:oxalate decarboxylase